MRENLIQSAANYVADNIDIDELIHTLRMINYNSRAMRSVNCGLWNSITDLLDEFGEDIEQPIDWYSKEELEDIVNRVIDSI
jgi:hypothetical protein